MNKSTILLGFAIAFTFANGPAHAQADLIRPGSTYSAARKLLLTKDYMPMEFSKQHCLDNASGRSAVCKAFPETGFCAGTGLANCQFVFETPDGNLLLVETEGEERDEAGRDIGLDLGVKRARLANTAESNRLRSESLKFTERSKAPVGLPTHDVNTVAFILSKEWLVMQKMSLDNGNLYFRRYGLKIANPSGDTDVDSATFELTTLDPPGSVVNGQFYVCRRSPREKDTLTVHLPATVELRSFKYSAWQSELKVSSLADGQSRRTKGEYIKGDLFLEESDIPADDFMQLLTAARVTYEFGQKNDRIQFIVEDDFADTRIKDFLRFAVPKVMQVNENTIRYFDMPEMLAACQNYKRTGTVPKFGTK
jgi:hypothetical protein